MAHIDWKSPSYRIRSESVFKRQPTVQQFNLLYHTFVVAIRQF